MKLARILLLLPLTLACGLTDVMWPTATPLPTSTALPTSSPSATSAPATLTPIPGPTSTTAPLPRPEDFCDDPAVDARLASFKSAVLASDGEDLAALVSPAHGMDVRYFRYVDPVNYDREHARFVFESTFVVNWGPQPGSGEDLRGPFHVVIVPSLQEVFAAPSTVTVCNEIRTGGATYVPEWPYPGVDFYSIHFPGTAANGNLDWQTWLVGIRFEAGAPYLYALIHLDWEP
jgi:hypothetical protein